MSRLKQLIHEIHRRSLWQILIAYLAGSWVLLQAADTATAVLGLPDWVPQSAGILCAIGLPLVIATAAVQKGGPFKPGPSADSVSAGWRRWLTWRRAFALLTLAVGAVAAGVTGYMAMRTLGIGPVGTLIARGVIEPQERIILADFENHTSDSLLAIVLTEAFRVDLTQSPSVTLMPPAALATALQRIQREHGASLTPELARELAIREGIKAVLTGDVGAAGPGFVLSARLVTPTDGTELLARREVAKDSTQIIDALDRLSKGVRERLGESLRSISHSDPLPAVTTASLQALRRFSLGLRAYKNEGDYDRAVALLEEAVSLDSTFAMAHAVLGSILDMMGRERGLVVAAMQNAFDLQEKLPDRERYRMLAMYHRLVTQERDKAIDANRSLLDIDPFDLSALNDLALHNAELGDYASAESLLVRVIEADSSASLAYMNLIEMQVAQGKLNEAESTLQTLAKKFPDNADVYDYSAGLAAARGDYDAAVRSYSALRDKERGSPFWQVYTGSQLSYLARLRGKLRQAERHLRQVMSVQRERGLAAGHLESAVAIAELKIFLQGGQDAGLEEVESALRRHPLDSIAPLDRPYLTLAEYFALAGESATAREFLDARAAVPQGDAPAPESPALHRAMGALALAEGRPHAAIDELKKAHDVWCPICSLPLLGQAYESSGQADSAIAVYERYIATPWLYQAIQSRSRYLATVHGRLGELYEQRLDTADALRYYSRLVNLWKDADTELQPRVEAARRAIEALSTGR